MSDNVPPPYIPSKKDVMIRKNRKNLLAIMNRKKMQLKNNSNDDIIKIGKSRVKTMINMRLTETPVKSKAIPSFSYVYASRFNNSSIQWQPAGNPIVLEPVIQPVLEPVVQPIRPRIVLINFEDDTMKPIIELEYKQMKILEEWYKTSGVPIDVESTDQIIPSEVPHEKLKRILYHDLNYSMKDEFVNSYLPLIFNQIISSDKIKKYEQMFSIIPENVNEQGGDIDGSEKITSNVYQPIHKINFGGDLRGDPVSARVMNVKSTNPIEVQPYGISSEKMFQSTDRVYVPSEKTSKYNSLHGIILPKNIAPCDKFYCDDGKEKNGFMVVKYIFETQETILDNIEVTEYNFDYNVLNPGFGTNAMLISDECSYLLADCSSIPKNKITMKKVDRKDVFTYSIMYNLKYNKSFVLKNPTDEEMELIKNIDNYGFVNLTNIQTNNSEIIELVKSNFSLCEFNSISEFNLKLNAFSENIEYISKHVNVTNNYANEEGKVKSFIKYNFSIDNNIDNRMKSSVLYDKIINSKIIAKEDISSFKIRLAKYLQDIGLEKKRYSDGIYYYGIKSKF